jgi:hypothetical protein
VSVFHEKLQMEVKHEDHCGSGHGLFEVTVPELEVVPSVYRTVK